jgi:ABC-type sugar transport system ATPase subunit
MSDSALKMTNINKSFGGIKVLNNVCFDVRRGEVHALLGENGAGKSVLMKTLMGVYRPDSGEYIVGGRPVRFHNPAEAQQNGVSMVYQEFGLIESLSVAENIFLGKLPLRNGVISWKKARELTVDMLGKIGSKILPDVIVEKLKVSEKQEVEIARALSYNPKVFIMDEPSAALSVNEIAHLYELINILRQREVAIIYITHKLNEAFDIANRVTVIRDGKILGTFDISDLNISFLIEKMTGKKMDSELVRNHLYQAPKQNVLELNNFSVQKMFNNINLTVGKGEIVGLAGLIGAGKSEIARSIFGLMPKKYQTTGKIIFEGRELNIKALNPSKCKAIGIGFVPEDRQIEGAIIDQSVSFNMILSSLNLISAYLVIVSRAARKLVWNVSRNVKLNPPNPDRLVKLLSGGNQQKVAIGKWLAAHPKLLILDEPTRGVDVGAREEIYDVVRGEARSMGMGVLLLSSDLREIMIASDRIFVMSLGRITHELFPQETTYRELLRFVTGGG